MITLPRDDLEKQQILAHIAKTFEKEKEYQESEVNDVIKSFDVDDYVLFRRELVNFNYLGKDSYRAVYWVKTYELTNEELDNIGKTQSKIKDMD